MPVGISQIRNSANEIIIDQNYLTLEVIQEGTVAANGSIATPQAIDYPATTNPMMFIQHAVNARYFFGPTTASRFWFSSNLAAGTTVPYKLCGFRIPATANPGGIGIMAHRTGTNEIAFHSRRKYLRIIDCFQTIALGGSSYLLRSGDAYNFTTDGGGGVNFWQIDHNTRPQSLSTYWLASLTGLALRSGSVNSTAWVIERKSTTRYEFRLDGDAVISQASRDAMGLPNPSPTNWDGPRLVAV